LLIVAWPNRDLIISALHLMFVAMSQDRLVDAVSLSTSCEPDIFDGKDCFELALQILGHSIMLARERLGTQFNNCFIPDRSLDCLLLSPPDAFLIDIHSSHTFPFLDPLLGSNV
jgi:hypothetical protein